jgi:hypothetical protein
MPFERIVLTDSKTLLLSGLLAIDLNKLIPDVSTRGLWKFDKILIEEEVSDTDMNKEWAGISFLMRDAELQLRGSKNKEWSATVRLRAIQSLRLPLRDSDLRWKLRDLRFIDHTERHERNNVKHLWYTTGQNVNAFGNIHQPQSGFLDNTGRWYEPVRSGTDPFAAA